MVLSRYIKSLSELLPPDYAVDGHDAYVAALASERDALLRMIGELDETSTSIELSVVANSSEYWDVKDDGAAACIRLEFVMTLEVSSGSPDALDLQCGR